MNSSFKFKKEEKKPSLRVPKPKATSYSVDTKTQTSAEQYLMLTDEKEEAQAREEIGYHKSVGDIFKELKKSVEAINPLIATGQHKEISDHIITQVISAFGEFLRVLAYRSGMRFKKYEEGYEIAKQLGIGLLLRTYINILKAEGVVALIRRYRIAKGFFTYEIDSGFMVDEFLDQVIPRFGPGEIKLSDEDRLNKAKSLYQDSFYYSRMFSFTA